jgi:oligoribonuclease NrnB/cAMP/cGMP phosphodiesterase (DHH superfamily)
MSTPDPHATPLVIYHANCRDGFCAAWIARKALGKIEAFPANYGQAPPDVTGRVVYVLDFSYPREVMERLLTAARRTVVLDHHKTAAEALDGLHQPETGMDVWFDMTKSGGRLAWEWFWLNTFQHQTIDVRPFPAPVRLDRAPWLVDYTEDRDLWRHALPETEAVNAALRSYPLDFEQWDRFAEKDPISTLAYEGRAIRRREQQIVRDHVRNARIEPFSLMVGGPAAADDLMVPVVNATTLFSEIAGELAKGHPFAACYFDRQDGKRQWSLRSAEDGADVAEIARAHGGGGHKHAAGFEQELAR